MNGNNDAQNLAQIDLTQLESIDCDTIACRVYEADQCTIIIAHTPRRPSRTYHMAEEKKSQTWRLVGNC